MFDHQQHSCLYTGGRHRPLQLRTGVASRDVLEFYSNVPANLVVINRWTKPMHGQTCQPYILRPRNKAIVNPENAQNLFVCRTSAVSGLDECRLKVLVSISRTMHAEHTKKGSDGVLRVWMGRAATFLIFYYFYFNFFGGEWLMAH